MPMILIMIEMHNSGIALFCCPCILHQNNHTTHPTYVFIVRKEDTLLLNALCSSKNQQLFNIELFLIKVATTKTTDNFRYEEAITCLPQNRYFL